MKTRPDGQDMCNEHWDGVSWEWFVLRSLKGRADHRGWRQKEQNVLGRAYRHTRLVCWLDPQGSVIFLSNTQLLWQREK